LPNRPATVLLVDAAPGLDTPTAPDASLRALREAAARFTCAFIELKLIAYVQIQWNE